MSYKIIVAMDNNKGIGINNKLPWKIKEDMKKFVTLTKGNGKNAIIMGKNTWLSLPKKPLKDRYNIILSTSLEDNNLLEDEGKIIRNIEDIIKFCENKFEEVWVIGGKEIYNSFIKKDLINELHITEIIENFNCDCYFPDIDINNWKLSKSNTIPKNENEPELTNKLYIKINHTE